MLAWILAHSGVLLSVVLGVSEALALIFPSETGFGGILAGVIKFIKALGVKGEAK